MRRIRQHAVAGCVALFCLMLAEPAFGQRDCQAPPGRSGLDQYCETLPGATGDRGAGAGGSGRDVSPGTERKLENSGATGDALLGLLGSGPRGGSGPGGGGGSASSGRAGGDGGSASSGRAGGDGGSSKGARSSLGAHSSKGGRPDGGSDKAADAPSNNVLSAIRSSADAGATSGPGFIWVLVIVTLVIVGVAWIRYRARGRAG
jgi:hypothetical protein